MTKTACRIPSSAQFARILKRIKKERGITFVHTGIYAKYIEWRAKKLLKKYGLDPGAFLDSRFVIVQKRKGAVVLCPKEPTASIFYLAKIAHEVEHDFQKRDLGSVFEFELGYLGKATRRHLEVQAELACADVYNFFGLPTMRSFDDKWSSLYQLEKRDQRKAQVEFDLGLERHKDNRYATKAGGYICRLIWEETR